MKILFTSYVFSPGVGGIETVAALLAPEFVRAGHEVILVTKTAAPDTVARPFKVVRKPGISEMLELTRWCDVFFQNNISLEMAWPLLFVRRPWIIGHQTFLTHLEGRIRWRSGLKNFLLRYARNASISRPIAGIIPVPSTIVGNPYSAQIFREIPGIVRDRELVYLGRLVSDKGIHILIEAVAVLRRGGVRPRLTIIGSGPEMPVLRELAERLQVTDQIEFAGSKQGDDLARALNAHQIMVIPSQWPEPFGLVALEGIACGCAVIASRTGGLPEAVGSCGLTFEAGSCLALSEALRMALAAPHFRENLQRGAQAHLANFTPFEVASRYLIMFEEALHEK